MSEKQDAARWRWFREHAIISTDEDGGLWIGATLAADDYEHSETYLTAKERRNLRAEAPRTSGIVGAASAMDRAADHHRKQP